MRNVLCLIATVGMCTALPILKAAEIGPESRTVWNCDDTAGIAGLALERENVKEGKAAVRWSNHAKTSGFSVPDVPKDWSRFNLLRLWLHNAKALPARFMIIIP